VYPLAVRTIGEGPTVVLVHGSVVGAEQTWSRQLTLADRWRLKLVNRPGFGGSPPPTRGDFDLEAPMIAEQLGDGAHLVGHSYGAVIALCAAGLRPEAVRSLTVSEPGCLRVAAHHPAVAEAIANGELLFGRGQDMEPLDFLRLFRGGAGVTRQTPEELDDELLAGVRLLMAERPSWEAEPPWQALREQPFPKLVLSGRHSPVFEAVCDAAAERLGARRDAVSGRGHTIPACGEPYNALLEAFMAQAETARKERFA
jgi:pimeloyl-ACP methyl ester carboxylesterase